MEFRDLKKQYQVLKDQMDRALLDTVAAGTYIMGGPVNTLEARLAEYVGVKHCLTCGNGTDALSLALMAWGIGPGDAVLVPSFTFFASAETVVHAGATPVLVDVLADTFNIDPAGIAPAVERARAQGLRPVAVMPVDLFGLPADYPVIHKEAGKYGLKILEDGAQGFGGTVGGRQGCSFGDISTTSFFPAKPLGCYGDGGAIFTGDDGLAELLTSLRFHGKGSDKYDNVRIGLNSRLDTLQAAILLVKLDAFGQSELAAVQRAAALYTERLASAVQCPVTPESCTSSWAQYTITLQSRAQRDGLQRHLKEHGVPSMVYYPKPMHLQSALKDLGYHPGDFPVSEQLCETVLSLPMHPYLTEAEIDLVSGAVLGYVQK